MAGMGGGGEEAGTAIPSRWEGHEPLTPKQLSPCQRRDSEGACVHCGNLGVMSCEPATLRQGWELWILPRHCLQEQGIQSISGCTWGTARGPRDSSRSLLILT